MRKIALFAFNGEAACFAHVLLNALDMEQRGWTARVVIEGAATKQISLLIESDQRFSNLYTEVRDKDLIDCVCGACSRMMGSIESAQEQGLNVCDELKGHPSIARYLEDGYEILTF